MALLTRKPLRSEVTANPPTMLPLNDMTILILTLTICDRLSQRDEVNERLIFDEPLSQHFPTSGTIRALRA